MKSTQRRRSILVVGLVVALYLLVLLTAVHAADAKPKVPHSVAPSRPPRDAWDYLSQIATPLGAVVAFVAAIITVRRSVRSWKWTYFTKEWSVLVQFLQPLAKFMDPSLTAHYATNFTGDDAMKYELIARLCIGYLDDLYFLGSEREIRTWFRGSVKLFAGTHRTWLQDHSDSYDPRFYEFILKELDLSAAG